MNQIQNHLGPSFGSFSGSLIHSSRKLIEKYEHKHLINVITSVALPIVATLDLIASACLTCAIVPLFFLKEAPIINIAASIILIVESPLLLLANVVGFNKIPEANSHRLFASPTSDLKKLLYAFRDNKIDSDDLGILTERPELLAQTSTLSGTEQLALDLFLLRPRGGVWFLQYILINGTKDLLAFMLSNWLSFRDGANLIYFNKILEGWDAKKFEIDIDAQYNDNSALMYAMGYGVFAESTMFEFSNAKSRLNLIPHFTHVALALTGRKANVHLKNAAGEKPLQMILSALEKKLLDPEAEKVVFKCLDKIVGQKINLGIDDAPEYLWRGAARFGCKKLIFYFFNECKTQFIQQAFDAAITYKQVDIALTLIDRGVQISDTIRSNPFYKEVLREKFERDFYLRKEEIEIVDQPFITKDKHDNGWNEIPLSLTGKAVVNREPYKVRSLLSSGAEVNQILVNGLSLLEYLSSYSPISQDIEIAEILLEYGAETNNISSTCKAFENSQFKQTVQNKIDKKCKIIDEKLSFLPGELKTIIMNFTSLPKISKPSELFISSSSSSTSSV